MTKTRILDGRSSIFSQSKNARLARPRGRPRFGGTPIALYGHNVIYSTLNNIPKKHDSHILREGCHETEVGILAFWDKIRCKKSCINFLPIRERPRAVREGRRRQHFGPKMSVLDERSCKQIGPWAQKRSAGLRGPKSLNQVHPAPRFYVHPLHVYTKRSI